MRIFLIVFFFILVSSCDSTGSGKIPTVLKEQNDTITLSERYYQEGLEYFSENEIEMAKESFKKAIDNCDSNDAKVQFRYYISLMGIYRMKNQYGDAFAAISEYENKNLLPEVEKVSNTLSTKQSLFLIAGQYQKALEVNTKLYDLSVAHNNEIYKNQSLIVRTSILSKLNREEESGHLLEQLLKKESISDFQKSFLITEKGIKAFHNNDFQAAIGSYKFSLEFSKKSKLDGRENTIAMQYANIAESFIELNRIKEAQQYLDSFKSIDQSKVGNNLKRNVFKYEIRIASALGVSNERIEALINKTTEDQEAFYKNRFDKELEYLEEEKSKSELLLKEKQTVEIEKLTFKNNSLLIGVFLILGIIAILFILFKQKRDHEIKNLKDQQRLLRAQMNPHFIFNVLSSIQNLVRTDSRSALNFITKFSRLLRIVLENSMKNYVSIGDEIEVIRNYLDLQKLRFPKLFDYVIDMDKKFEEDMICIPPMLIQPFVENAIEHGFKGIDYKGSIHITLKKKGVGQNTKVHTIITDNGLGYPVGVRVEKKSASVQLISAFIRKSTGKEIKRDFTDPLKQTGTTIEFEIPTN